MATPWSVPPLTREGQEAFWSRQSDSYDTSPLTNDNAGELALVSLLTDRFYQDEYIADDVVTLGGAVGSRDPLVVLEALGTHGRQPSRIFFNDLSEKMVARARRRLNTLYPSVSVTSLPGAIHEVASGIPAKPRRVIIGVYRAEALLKPEPHYGYPLNGFREYLASAEFLGSRFIFEPVIFKDGALQDINVKFECSPFDSDARKLHIEHLLAEAVRSPATDAIRVIAFDDGQEGFFLSHWYTEEGAKKVVRATMQRDHAERRSIMPVAKGYVLCIDPVTPPRGIVTMLNNVLGNILPHEQIATLNAIDTLSR